MTSQILNDMLTHKYISVEEISLIIFDECHHAVDDHPMRSIMKHFEKIPKNNQPRILGMFIMYLFYYTYKYFVTNFFLFSTYKTYKNIHE